MLHTLRQICAHWSVDSKRKRGKKDIQMRDYFIAWSEAKNESDESVRHFLQAHRQTSDCPQCTKEIFCGNCTTSRDLYFVLQSLEDDIGEKVKTIYKGIMVSFILSPYFPNLHLEIIHDCIFFVFIICPRKWIRCRAFRRPRNFQRSRWEVTTNLYHHVHSPGGKISNTLEKSATL